MVQVAAGVAFTLMVLSSLVLVSLTAARPSWLSPTSQRAGDFPIWLAGPLGHLTSWFTLDFSGLNIAFTVLVATMYGCYLIVVFAAPRLRPELALGPCARVPDLPALPADAVDRHLQLHQLRANGGVHGLNPYTTIPAFGPSTDPTYRSRTGTDC